MWDVTSFQLKVLEMKECTCWWECRGCIHSFPAISPTVATQDVAASFRRTNATSATLLYRPHKQKWRPASCPWKRLPTVDTVSAGSRGLPSGSQLILEASLVWMLGLKAFLWKVWFRDEVTSRFQHWSWRYAHFWWWAIQNFVRNPFSSKNWTYIEISTSFCEKLCLRMLSTGLQWVRQIVVERTLRYTKW